MRTKFKETKKIKEYGRVDFYPRHSVVSINPSKGGTPDSIIHELLHVTFEFLTEKEVQNLTKIIISKTTLKDQERIIRDFIKRC